MNKLLIKSLLALCCVLMPATVYAQKTSNEPATVKKERNAIKSGNKLYKAKKYAEAEVQYRKALEANPNSEIAQFNLASSLLKQDHVQPQPQQGGEQQMSATMQEATGLLQQVAQASRNKRLASKASYDLGNIAYHQQNWEEAISNYKQALRKNPDNNDARYNLRLAQLKKQQQDKNKDKNNQNKNQNKDQNKDKNKDQNKDQNKNQDKKDKDKQNQDKQNQDKQNQNKQNQDKQQQQPQKGDLSKQNMDRILQTMQDKERETQQKMNARKAQMQRSERARTRNKW